MQADRNQPVPRSSWFAIALMILLLMGMFGFGDLKYRLRIAHEFKRFSAPSEADLTYVSVRVVDSSWSKGLLKLAFADGREAWVRFVDIPTGKARGRQLAPQGFGAFKGPNAFEYACPQMHAELLKNYWIYAIDCDGVPVLRYTDTLRYLKRRMDELGVQPSEYGPVIWSIMKWI